MKSATVLILTFLSSVAFGSDCVSDLKGKHSDDGIIKISDFDDLNGDGTPETIVLLNGDNRAAYGVIYTKGANSCFKQIYSGSENVTVSKAPDLFQNTNWVKDDRLNGFRLLRDSSWGQDTISITYYGFDAGRGMYREIFSTNEYAW